MTDTDLTQMLHRLDRIEAAIHSLIEQKSVKEWYSVEEVAARLDKAAFTVREWCRLGRVRAQKRAYTRGPHAEWMISHVELLRIQHEGLLPTPAPR